MMTRLTLALTTGVVFAAPAIAQDEEFKLDALSCFEVQSLAEEDSLFLTGMLIGHLMGGDSMTPNAIKAAIEKMDTTCGDNPDMLAIEALSS